MIPEHLQNKVEIGKIESFQPVDRHTLEPELYENRQLTFTIGKRTYTIKAWIPNSTIKPEHRELIPVNKHLIDVTMQSSTPNMCFEFQLDLRNLELLTLHYHGSKGIDINDAKEIEKIKREILSGLGYIALTHLTQQSTKRPDKLYV